MPIEIKELKIKMGVTNSFENRNPVNVSLSNSDQDRLVKKITAQVISNVQRQLER